MLDASKFSQAAQVWLRDCPLDGCDGLDVLVGEIKQRSLMGVTPEAIVFEMTVGAMTTCQHFRIGLDNPYYLAFLAFVTDVVRQVTASIAPLRLVGAD